MIPSTSYHGHGDNRHSSDSCDSEGILLAFQENKSDFLTNFELTVG